MPSRTTVKHVPTNFDPVNNPSHYMSPYPLATVYKDEKTGEYYTDAISVIKAWGFQYKAYLFNLLKYILRAGRKEDNDYVQELGKVGFYLDEEIEDVKAQLAAAPAVSGETNGSK